jgi:hypothetical protein
MAEHPIKDYLLRNVENPFRRPLEAALLDHGRPFVGIARPKGYRRLRRVQHCFFNSLTIATDECGTYPQGGTYVEGYAISRDGRGVPLHHAWITLDGTNAIDVTWRAPPEQCLYFGIPLPRAVLRTFICETHGAGPVLRDYEDGKVQQVLAEAGYHSQNDQGGLYNCRRIEFS